MSSRSSSQPSRAGFVLLLSFLVVLTGCQKAKFEQMWLESPVTAIETKVGEVNDIRLVVESCDPLRIRIEGNATATNVFDDCVDFDCDLGEFRISFAGSPWSPMRLKDSGQGAGSSLFEWLKEGYTISKDCRDESLWERRVWTLPAGCRQGLWYFSMKSKKGFISGRFDEPTPSQLQVFDAAGHCQITVLRKNTKGSGWEELASRLIVLDQSEVQSK